MSKHISKTDAVFKGIRADLYVEILSTERAYCSVCDADYLPTKPYHAAGVCAVCFAAGTQPVEIPCLELRP